MLSMVCFALPKLTASIERAHLPFPTAVVFEGWLIDGSLGRVVCAGTFELLEEDVVVLVVVVVVVVVVVPEV